MWTSLKKVMASCPSTAVTPRPNWGTCWFLLWLSKASGWCWPGRGRACRWDGGETCPPGSSSLLLPHLLLLLGLLLPGAGSFHAVRTSLPDVMSRSGKTNLICHHSHLFFESLPVLLLLSGRRQLHHLLLTRLWRKRKFMVFRFFWYFLFLGELANWGLRWKNKHLKFNCFASQLFFDLSSSQLVPS